MRPAATDHTDGSATGRGGAAVSGSVPGQRRPDGAQPAATGESPDPPVGLTRLRLLVALGMGTVLVSYGALVPIGALAVLGAGGELTADAAFVLAAPLWLAAHQVPLVLDGAPLSVLPLLPTIGVGALVMIGCSAVARRLGGRNPGDAGPVVATVAAAHGMVAVLLSAMLPPAGAVAAAPWAALLGGALTAGAAGTIGVLRACGPPPRWRRAPRWVRIGGRAGGAGLVGLAACSATLVFAALVSSAAQVHDAIAAAGQPAAAVGLTALSAGYLPNALGAALSWLLGPGFAVGGASASVFGVVAGPLPGVPLLAAMPTGPPPGWAPLVFVLPALVGAAVGLLCRPAGELRDRLRAVAVAALVAAAGVAVIAAASGGRLAGGPFDPVDVRPWAAAAAAFGWVALPAALICLGAPAGRPRRPADRAARRSPDRSQ